MTMIKFPSTGLDPNEQARRLTVEVERLSHQPDWMYWVEREDHAQHEQSPAIDGAMGIRYPRSPLRGLSSCMTT
jgi:hypothetical protein